MRRFWFLFLIFASLMLALLFGSSALARKNDSNQNQSSQSSSGQRQSSGRSDNRSSPPPRSTSSNDGQRGRSSTPSAIRPTQDGSSGSGKSTSGDQHNWWSPQNRGESSGETKSSPAENKSRGDRNGNEPKTDSGWNRFMPPSMRGEGKTSGQSAGGKSQEKSITDLGRFDNRQSQTGEQSSPRTAEKLRSTLAVWNHPRAESYSRGGQIPKNAPEFARSPTLATRYNRVVNVMGCEPRNRFYFVARGRHAAMANRFYYPYYCPARPDRCYPSVFCLWDWFPCWIEPTRIVLVEEVPVMTVSDMDLINRHLASEEVSIYFDGKYNYSSSETDFAAMAADEMSSIQTTSLNLDPTVWISKCEVFVSGRQDLKDPDGNEKTLYLSFRLRKMDGNWLIMAFGSSANPVACPYKDCRFHG